MAQVTRVPFPFAKVLASIGGGEPDRYRWKAGIRWEEGYEDRDAVADGVGAMLITEIGRYTPPGFLERVFYTRRFESPDGKQWGKSKLRVIAASGFTRLLKGYRYEYELVDGYADVAMVEWESEVERREDLADAAGY